MFASDDCILIMGQRRCGKSYLGSKIQQIWPRKVIIDTLAEYNEGEIVYSFHEFTEALQRLKSSQQNNFTLVFKFDPESHQSELEFNHILRLCYYFGNIQIVVEEIHLFSGPHNMPLWLQNNYLIGRHHGISILATSQRPAHVNKTIVSQSAHIFCGKTVESNDLRYLSSFLGQENSQKLVQMPERQFLYFSKSGIKTISNDF